MAGTTVSLNNEDQLIDSDNDNIVIVNNFASIPGGRSLDVTGYLYPVLNAGHPIIMDNSTPPIYKPLPVNGAALVALGVITPGSAYTNGTYNNVPLTGGSGSTATAKIVVAGGVVVSVDIVNAGKEYKVGDSLSASAASIGGTGTGFAVPVTKINYIPDSYAALPANHTYEGILIASILTRRPFAGIMRQGTVNPAAGKIVPTSGQISAFKAALPLIDFRQD